MSECAHVWIARHVQERDRDHTTTGACCPCLPELFCARCKMIFLAQGEAASGVRPWVRVATHVYPAWAVRDDGPDERPPTDSETPPATPPRKIPPS